MLRKEFSFLRCNILVVMISWLVMNFAGSVPNTYYSLFVLGLGGIPFIIGGRGLFGRQAREMEPRGEARALKGEH